MLEEREELQLEEKEQQRLEEYYTMGYKCSVVGCFTNYAGYDKGTVFSLPEDSEQRKKWIMFLNREDHDALKRLWICHKHFDEKMLHKTPKRVQLNSKLKPVPTIIPSTQKTVNLPPAAVMETIKNPRKPPANRIFFEDEMQKFNLKNSIASVDDIISKGPQNFEEYFHFEKKQGCVIIYKLEEDHVTDMPQVTYAIHVSEKLRVKLYYKNAPIPLPTWFRQGRNTVLNNCTMFQPLVNHMRQVTEKPNPIISELTQLQYGKKPSYSPQLVRYALQLRYTSLQAYQLLQQDLQLPSVSYLRSLTTGSIDAIAAAKALLHNERISSDVILMFDEMYLEKCEEYVGGKSYGVDAEGNLFKGLVCFMIVGLKKNISLIVKSVPETKISGTMLVDELTDTINTLQEIGFNVRGVVCDNHSSNVAAFRILMSSFGREGDSLRTWMNKQPIYLFYDTVHLVKNIRNNLLNNKRFLFPPFVSKAMKNEVKVPGGELSWSLLHRVHEKDEENQANLRAAPKLSSTVLHPGNCKQSVPTALAIFDPSTIAAILTYFPSAEDSAGFLNLISTWWSISNAKSPFNSRYHIGDAAIKGDGKPEFMREMADWLYNWKQEAIPNSQKFTLSAQTSSAMTQTLRCQASLIEDLLSDGYKFVLTARFQSDPLEKRYGQYRQMSGGRFLVSAKDVARSENILKIKSLVKEGFQIEDSLKEKEISSENVDSILQQVEMKIQDENSLKLDDSSRDVSDHIAGYIAHKACKVFKECCSSGFTSLREEGGSKYTSLLSRGGLVHPHPDLSEVVAKSFATLDICSNIIHHSQVPSRQAGLAILRRYVQVPELACAKHEENFSSRVLRTICNCFFDGQRKRSNDSVIDDKIRAFKKSKRNKE